MRYNKMEVYAMALQYARKNWGIQLRQKNGLCFPLRREGTMTRKFTNFWEIFSEIQQVTLNQHIGISSTSE